jgi:hypothetical protein
MYKATDAKTTVAAHTFLNELTGGIYDKSRYY